MDCSQKFCVDFMLFVVFVHCVCFVSDFRWRYLCLPFITSGCIFKVCETSCGEDKEICVFEFTKSSEKGICLYIKVYVCLSYIGSLG